MNRTCGECMWRFYDEYEWICANTFSNKCSCTVGKNFEACDCFEKPMSLDEILKEVPYGA